MNQCFGVKLSLVTASITLGVTALIANPVQAATITLLEDTFEAETLGLGKTDLTNWTTTRGNVDVIGQDASGAQSFNFKPGNGMYLDLGGYLGGTLVSKQIFDFEVGDKIELSFDWLGSNGNGNSANVKFDIGNLYSEIFTTSQTPATITRLIDVSTATSSRLVFEEIDSDRQGLLLDNVSLRVVRSETQNVPEPITGLVIAAGMSGVALRRAKSKKLNH